MFRFVVYGTCMEYIASLCVLAETPEQAIEAWKKAFEDKVGSDCKKGNVSCWDIRPWNLDGAEAYLEKDIVRSFPIWKGDGDKYWSGGYHYNF